MADSQAPARGSLVGGIGHPGHNAAETNWLQLAVYHFRLPVLSVYRIPLGKISCTGDQFLSIRSRRYGALRYNRRICGSLAPCLWGERETERSRERATRWWINPGPGFPWRSYAPEHACLVLLFYYMSSSRGPRDNADVEAGTGTHVILFRRLFSPDKSDRPLPAFYLGRASPALQIACESPEFWYPSTADIRSGH